MPRSTINGTAIDLDGKEMILDADQDTTLTVDTDDQIDIKVAGSDKLKIDASSHLVTHTAGTSNLVLGVNAGNSIASGGNYNVALGDEAGTSLTTGLNNTIVGALAGDALTDADQNVAIGTSALGADTQGSQSTAVGSGALQFQNFTSSTISYNTAVGYEAGNDITTAQYNTLVGYQAGDAIDTGGTNTALGVHAGGALTSGSGNIMIGIEVGVNTVAVDTGVNNILIGYQARASATNASQQIVLGRQVTSAGNNNFTFGDGGTDSNIAFGATSISAPSDQRYKEEIETATAGLSFINDLRPVTFKWKKQKDIPPEHDSYVESSNTRVMNSLGETHHGFIAQEVKTAIDNHSELKDGFDMWSIDERDKTDGRQRLAEGALIPILTKALQELSAKNDALEARIKKLEGS